MAKTICLLNFKGGVGKTTMAVNLAAALNKHNNKVLVIDMDVQCTATSAYKPKNEEQAAVAAQVDITIHDMLTGKIDDGIKVYPTATEGISYIPSSPEMKYIENDMSRNREKTHVLQHLLAYEDLQAYYDYIIIDCPPGEGVVTDNAMIASDYLLIPVKCEDFSVQGLVNIMAEVADVQKHSNPKLQILGIVSNELQMEHRRKTGIIEPKVKTVRKILADIKELYPDLVFDTYIRHSSSLSEFSIFAQNVFDYAPDSIGATDYAALADELESRISNLNKQ